MASLGAAAFTSSKGLVFGAGSAFTGAGILGFALVAGAGFVDSKFLMPAILGRRQKGQRSEELLSLPQAGVGLGRSEEHV